jgi:anti-anti-sigma regulatory factor
MDAATQQTGSGNLTIEKLSEGQMACLKFRGSIDETFEGKKLSATVRAQTLVIDLGSVTKISSFGLREWSDFMRGVEKSAKQIFLVECTPKVVDQLNMVANFAGKGLVYSFYAPYRCDYCDIDRQVLFQVDRDREPIKSMRPPEQPCETCGNPEYLDEDPATFFSYLAKQPEVEIDSEVASFLSSKLGYSVTEAPRRLQIEKHVDGRSTYLKLSGNLDGSFPREKIAEGLEGTIVIDVSGVGAIDPAGAAEWRGLVAMVAPFVDRIYLLGCPPAFLERLARREDLGEEVEVLSFSMPYQCATCSTTVAKEVEVAEHHEILKFATPPEMKCDDCKAQTTCVASETLLSQLPALPEPTVTGELRKFIKEAQAQQKRERIAAVQPAKPSVGLPRYVTGLLTLSSAAVLVLIGYLIYDQRTRPEQAAVVPTEPNWIDQRPDWITIGTPATAYCSDLINRLVCVGVSSYAADREDGRVEAANAAKEELANAIGLKIESAEFAAVRDLYGDARRDALVELDDARGDEARFAAALAAMRERRAAVARILDATGGAAVPSQPTETYWEEYNAPEGSEHEAEYLVFTRFDVSMDALRRLVERYRDPVEVRGSRAITLFPSLAWNEPDLASGALILEAGGGLARLGVQAHDIVTAVGGEPIRDAAGLAEAVASAGGGLALSVVGRDGEHRRLGEGAD